MSTETNYDYTGITGNRIVDLLITVRDSLADHAKARWSDSRLLRIMDEAQRLLALKSNTLRSKETLNLLVNTADYTLPEDAHRILRVLWEDKVLPLMSHEQMDRRFGEDWLTHTGDIVEAIVYDKLNRSKIRIYPIPDYRKSFWQGVAATSKTFEPSGLNSVYGVVVDTSYEPDTVDFYGVVVDIDYLDYINTVGESCICTSITPEPDEASLSSPYGVMVDLFDALYFLDDIDPNYGVVVQVEGYSLSSIYGITADFSSDYINFFVNQDPEVEGIYGIMTNFTDLAQGITIYYNKRPSKIDSIYNTLEVDSYYDTALKHYVVGMALRDDKDTQNRSLGNEELQLADSILAEAIKDNFNDFTSQNTQYITPYDNGFGLDYRSHDSYNRGDF